MENSSSYCNLLEISKQKGSPHYIGLKKDRNGFIYEYWTSEDKLHAKRLRYYLSKSHLWGFGLFTSKINKNQLIKLTDWYLNQPLQTRRKFIKNLMGGFLAGAGLSACKEMSETTDPISETFEIIGPSEVSLNKMGSQVEANFTYKGNVKLDNPSWRLITPIELQRVFVYDGVQELKCGFPVQGEMTLSLFEDPYTNNSLAQKSITVNPPVKSNKQFDLPVLLLVEERPSDRTNLDYGVYTYNYESKAITKLFVNDKIYDDCISWSPDGKMMAFTYCPNGRDWRTDPHKIAVFDLTTGKFKLISSNTDRLAWKVSWSPTGEWIAYCDDSKSWGWLFGKLTQGTVDEIKLTRPDGSDQFYLRGEGDRDYILNNGRDYSAMSLSWNPTGDKLIGAQMGSLKKLVVFEKLFGGKPERTMFLPSNQQLKKLYLSNNFNAEQELVENSVPGANGIAWSPSGEYIVYTLQFGWDPAYNLLALSKIDGTGGIRILDMRSGNTDYKWVEVLISPTWSPDGKKVYYSSWKEFGSDLFEIDLSKNDAVPKKIKPGLLNPRAVNLYG